MNQSLIRWTLLTKGKLSLIYSTGLPVEDIKVVNFPLFLEVGYLF